MGDSRPSLKWDGQHNRWEVKGKGGVEIVDFANKQQVQARDLAVASLANIERMEVGSTGDYVTKIYGAVASSPNHTIPSGNAVTYVSLPFTGVTPGDNVFANPKTALTNALVLGAHIPGNNIVHVYLGTRDQSAGSLPALGWDLLAMRTA